MQPVYGGKSPSPIIRAKHTIGNEFRPQMPETFMNAYAERASVVRVCGGGGLIRRT
jgi:hypothetical protein